MVRPPPRVIVLCITDLDTGGAERSLVELAARLPTDRFRPIMVSLAPPPEPPRETLLAELAAANIPVEFLGARTLLQAPKIIARLTQQLRRWQPQLVQSVLLHANVAAAIAARRAGIGHVVSGIRVAERRSNLHRYLTRRTARLVDYHVCVSQSVADFSRQVTGLSRDRLVVIPTGVDLTKLPARTATRLTGLGLATGRRMILAAARLDPQKRLDWLLERAAMFLAQLPQHDLVIAGEGPAEKSLRRLATRLGIGRRVHFTGWRTDLPEMIAAGDLVVLTSAWEGLPRVVLEAMASGKPVVTTDVEGVAELLGPLDTDQLVGHADAAGFAHAVVRIASDPDYGAQIGLQNRHRIADHFNLDQTVAAYVSLYDTILGRPTTSPEAPDNSPQLP